MNKQRIGDFQAIVWDFYKNNKRNFPWRQTQDPYKILVSEIMLQQTQADRVIPFYEKFIKHFPNFTTLAHATFSDIYPLWQGLGYNRRALALPKTAQKTITQYKGKLPQDIALLEEFPGIGPYTARAVSIFSFNTPVACIETNIRRVFIHHFFPESQNYAEINAEKRGKKIDDKEILELAERALDHKNPREWHWALMDYGAYLKTLRDAQGRPIPNPNRRHKNYSVQSKFEGSLRQIRGATLRILSGESTNLKTLISRIEKATGQDVERIKKVIAVLEKEKLIVKNKNIYSLN